MSKISLFFVLFITLLSSNILFGQVSSYQVSDIQKYAPKAINIENINSDFHFTIQNIEMPVPGSASYRTYLEKVKSQIPPKDKTESVSNSRSKTEKPILLYNFEGNRFNGHVPNDNDLAISNDGIIMSVINSDIYFYNQDSQIHPPISLDTFAASFNLPQGKYDPRVLYDPEKDRFIFAFLNGFNDLTSKIFIAFSQTNNPAGDWNIYTLPGNPLNDTSWSDFPMIAISKDELFLTINLLKNMGPGDTWKTTFKQTLVWQIDKNSGFNGDSLVTRHFDNMMFEGVKLRNMCPVQSGDALTGPEIYLLSNRNFALNTDSFYLAKITGKINDLNSKLEINLIKSDVEYGVPPSADQPVKRFLETNDARILDAFQLDDAIYFAGNTVNFNNNFASIYLGKLTGLTGTRIIKLNIIQNSKLEFGYPSLAYTGKLKSDEFIMLANHSSDSVYPGISSFFYKNGELSDPLLVKEGLATVTVQSGPTQRWGDYTGLQRKYNENGIVWGSGYFGKLYTSQRINSTWIAQLKSPSFSTMDEKPIKPSSICYPNPVETQIYLQFSNPILQICDFILYDNQGRRIKLLQQSLIKPGLTSIGIDLSPLPAGYYFIKLEGTKGLKESFKVVKE